jgi:hypothetical protein
MDWYTFTKDLVVTSAFSQNAIQNKFAREFINQTFAMEKIAIDSVYSSPESLTKAIDLMKSSPEHVFWFEYNFLFVLAAQGSIHRLGDHSVEGYRQRSRFYEISDNAKLLFAKRIVEYIFFLCESTGMAEAEVVNEARKKCAAFKQYKDLLEDI